MRLVVIGLAFLTGLCFGMQQPTAWNFVKQDPVTKKRVVTISAESFDQSTNGHTKHLHNVSAQVYDSSEKVAQTISSKEAVADFDTATFRYGPDLKSVLSLKR